MDKQSHGWPARFVAFPYPGCFPLDFAAGMISRYSRPNDLIYDPFCGRGTTLVAAASLGRRAAGADRSPLARLYARAALHPVPLSRALRGLQSIDLAPPDPTPEEWAAWERFHAYFHPRTFGEILALRRTLNPQHSRIDRELAALACALLLGKSKTHLSSVAWLSHTVSTRNRLRNNYRRGVAPEYRSVHDCIAYHLRRLAANPPTDGCIHAAAKVRVFDRDAERPLPVQGVSLVLTSPPYPGAIDFAREHALPLWFLSHFWRTVRRLGAGCNLPAWRDWMLRCLSQWSPCLTRSGRIVLEVGEARRRGGRIDLEAYLAAASFPDGLRLVGTTSHPLLRPKRSYAYRPPGSGVCALRVLVLEKR